MEKKTKVGQSRGDRIFDLVNHILVFLLLAICIYPLYYTIIASFSEPEHVLSGRVYLWIKGFTLDSYRSVLDYDMIWVGYRNTIFYTVVGTLYNLIVLIPASYALSKKEMKFKGPLMLFFVFTMYFGGGMIPTYLNMKNLNLIDSIWVMIIPSAFSVYNMIITRTFFMTNFSESLAEAARIDGAGEFRIFIQIALPLSSAIIAVMTLYHAVGRWNSYFNALLYLNDSQKYPLQMVLRTVLLQNTSVRIDTGAMTTEEIMDNIRKQKLAETLKYAVIFIANAPVLAMYPFVQKYFTKGIMVGSIKG